MQMLLLLSFFFGALLFASLLAWKNLRLGRGDRRGALRLALFIFALQMLGWLGVSTRITSQPLARLIFCSTAFGGRSSKPALSD